jgi:glycine betaine/choline ABC-type transport system substrate-binding protein
VVLADDKDDLARLNQQVDANRERPADVARRYLEDEGLLT